LLGQYEPASLPRPKAKKGRGAWTFGSKERKEFAEFYAAEASAAATTSQGGTSTARLYGLTCTAPRSSRTTSRRCRNRVSQASTTTKALWESALARLGFENRNDPATTQVANLIILLAKGSQCDPSHLAERATEIVRGSS
jgi:hypothetical protein